MNKFYELESRIEKIAFEKPKMEGDSVRCYLFLAGEAHRLLGKLDQVRLMDLPEDFELSFIEKQVEDIEKRIKKIC